MQILPLFPHQSSPDQLTSSTLLQRHRIFFFITLTSSSASLSILLDITTSPLCLHLSACRSTLPQPTSVSTTSSSTQHLSACRSPSQSAFTRTVPINLFVHTLSLLCSIQIHTLPPSALHIPAKLTRDGNRNIIDFSMYPMPNQFPASPKPAIANISRDYRSANHLL